MSVFGRGLSLKGDISGAEELTIEGRVDGAVWCADGVVTLSASAEVTGEVIARDITVFGRVDGQLIASEVVDLREDSTVDGKVISARLIVNDGAAFNGRSEPQHLETALRVARYQWQQRHGEAAPTVPAPSPTPTRPPPVIRRRSGR